MREFIQLANAVKDSEGLGNMKQKITVFGSYVTDLMSRTPHLPLPAETVKGTVFSMSAGGKGFNQAIAAKKMDADVVMVTKMAKDPFGKLALDLMDELSMDTSHILYSETEGTGTALIMVDESTGQNEIVVVPGACGAITLKEVERCAPLIQKSGYLLVQFEVNMDAMERAVEIAHEAGVCIVMNPAPYQDVSDKLLGMADIVTPNEVEAEGLTGIKVDSEESARLAAEILHKKGVGTVVITMGHRGSFVSTGEEHHLLPPFTVDALDTTGAGDAFNGGMVAGLAEGMDIWQAARFASAVAALSVTKIGTSKAMPQRSEVEALLAE